MATAKTVNQTTAGDNATADLEADIRQLRADIEKLAKQMAATGQQGYGTARRAAAEGVDFDHARVELLGEKQPSRRFTTPEQIGDLAVFLCSAAADNMTGSSITIDGGWTAQ